MTHHIIATFIKDKYMIWNTDKSTKRPLVGTNELGWSKISYKSVKQFWNFQQNKNWGIRTGIQPNQKYIIGLDFDLWFKEQGSYVECKNTRKIWKQFSRLTNEQQDGIFESSTIDNRGVLVDITNCPELIDMLNNIKKQKFNKLNYNLEILNGFPMILPPSITKCKIYRTYNRHRRYLNTNPIMILTEDTDIYHFIYKYIKDCTPIQKTIGKRDIRGIEKRETYEKYINKLDNNENIINGTDIYNKIKNILDLLDKQQGNNYNNWYKTGLSILNTFKDNEKDAFKAFNEWSSECEGYDYDELLIHWKSWKKWLNNNDCMINFNYVCKIAENDNPRKFLLNLVKLERENWLMVYNEQKTEFEKYVFKVLEPKGYMKKSFQSGWEMCSWDCIKHRFESQYDIKFLQEWKKDKNKLEYNYCDFIPKSFTKRSVDEKVFNLFDGYEIDTVDFDDNLYENEVELLKTHIKIICNNNTNTIDFFTQWIANLVLDAQKRNDISIVLRGQKGCGKGTIYEMLHKILGYKLCLTTGDPRNNIFSKFNHHLMDKLLINIEESDSNSFYGYMEQLKSLITAKDYIFEKKGYDKIKRQVFWRTIINTNHDGIFKIDTNTRRFFFIECSSEMVTNSKYFENLYNAIDNIQVLKRFCKWLETIYDPNYNFQQQRIKCKTQYQKRMEINDISPFWTFLQTLIENNEYNSYITTRNHLKIKPKDLFREFTNYCDELNITSLLQMKGIKNKLQKITEKCKSQQKGLIYYYIKISNIITYLKENNLYQEINEI